MWREADNKLIKKFKFKDFTEALSFVNKVGELAEAAQHHPDVSFGWGYVEITLTTHSQGKVTQKDRDLSQKIDNIG